MSLPTFSLADDVPATFAAIAVAAQNRHGGRLRYAASGGGGGRACMEALAQAPLAWDGVELFQVDERCVPADSPDCNATNLAAALGPRLDALQAFHKMDCTLGAHAYEELLRASGPLDLVQLGVGPDGHTASLFPDSLALHAPSDRLVAENHDPAGRNPHERLTLTYSALEEAQLVVFTVFGADKHPILERLAAGEDLPAARVSAARVVFLVDAAAAGTLATTPVPGDLLGGRA